MRFATWNLNNRVGTVRFRPEAALAAARLGADVIAFTEYYPQSGHDVFCATLAEAGWPHQLPANGLEELPEKANRVLLVSKVRIEPHRLTLPDFDLQFPANMVAARLPDSGISILGIRVPAYESKDRTQLLKSWAWLEATAGQWRDSPAIILGDLNITPNPSRGPRAKHFRNILQGGWQRAEPAGGVSYFAQGEPCSEIDHVLATAACRIGPASYVTDVEGFKLAGGHGAISDHAALVVDIDLH